MKHKYEIYNEKRNFISGEYKTYKKNVDFCNISATIA